MTTCDLKLFNRAHVRLLVACLPLNACTNSTSMLACLPLAQGLYKQKQSTSNGTLKILSTPKSSFTIFHAARVHIINYCCIEYYKKRILRGAQDFWHPVSSLSVEIFLYIFYVNLYRKKSMKKCHPDDAFDSHRTGPAQQ